MGVGLSVGGKTKIGSPIKWTSVRQFVSFMFLQMQFTLTLSCLLYTSDAADE